MRSIGVTEEQYSKMQQVKQLYEKDMRLRFTWGEYLLNLSIAYYTGRQALIEGTPNDVDIVQREE